MKNDTFALGYSHPSMILLVDDSPQFLRNLEISIPGRTLYKSFVNPEQALAYINQYNGADKSLVHKAITYQGSRGESAMISVDMAKLEGAIGDKDRFLMPTVVISDYDMPIMNGLELFEQIQDPAVKKLLLTGKADETMGVDAFNQGLIDRFVLKNSSAVGQSVFDEAAKLQQLYFADLQNPVLTATSGLSSFFGDKIAIQRITNIALEYGYVEHYLTTTPLGYLMVRANGELGRIAIYDAQACAYYLHFAEQYHAPKYVLDQLRSQDYCVMLYDNIHYAEPDWDECIFPCEKVDGATQWYIAVDHNPPTPVDYDAEVSCFNTTLRAEAQI